MKAKQWTVYIPEFLPPTEWVWNILDPVAEIKEGLPGDKAQFIANVQKADAIICSARPKMTRKVIEACPIF